ncbi:sulfotransferase 1C2-like [Stigmatopora nigra]
MSEQQLTSDARAYKLMDVQGIPLPDHIAKDFEDVAAFLPDPKDVLISSYPKSGTTWTVEVVDQLFHNGDAQLCKRAPITTRCAFLEASTRIREEKGLDLLKRMDPPRLIKTHLPLQLVPQGFFQNKCKLIYVARNPKDTVVSNFHFEQINMTTPDTGNWDAFLDYFLNGELEWGYWYDHVKGYWEGREKWNIFYLFYEDMKEDPRREVVRLMKYLDLSLTDEAIDRVVEQTSFKEMRENPMANYSVFPKTIYDTSNYRFMRKGMVGDWQNHFTGEQAATFDLECQKRMGPLSIPFRDLL